MTAFFLRIVNISISASVFTAVILLLRPLMKKVPRWVYVLLWGLVALRLILPFSIESPISLMPRTDWVIEESIQGQVPSVDSEPLPDSPPAAESTEFEEPPAIPAPPPVAKPEGDREIHIPFVLSCSWIAGVVGMLAYTVISTHRLQKSLGTAIRLRDNIYESTAIDAPLSVENITHTSARRQCLSRPAVTCS